MGCLFTVNMVLVLSCQRIEHWPGEYRQVNYTTAGDAVTMTSESQVFVINHGQSLEMLCEFSTYEFDMFDNPIVWKKFQRGEEHQINIMGNIFEPFLSTKRFEVAFAADVPRFSFPLHVASK